MASKKNSEDLDFSKLGSFQSIDPEADWKRVTQRISFEKNRSLNKRYPALAWRVAASIIIILGIGYLSRTYLFSPPEMIFTGTGDEQQMLKLPDGSEVTLNSNSQLIYPEKFRAGKREVRLVGEAFFKVERNPDNPFRISVEEKAMVEVLGTSFNIRSEQAGEAISLFVVEGRVLFSTEKEEQSGLILNKDEQATLKEGILKREDDIDLNILSWKTGILHFDQSNIADVVYELESHYKREIVLDEDISRDLLFTSTIDNQDLESVLEELSMVLGLAISCEDDLIIISKPQ